MHESTDQDPSAGGRLAHGLTAGQDTADTITDELIERGPTLNDLKPVLTYLGTLIECTHQIAVLAADVVRDVDTKHLTKNGLNGVSISSCLTYTRSLIDANAEFLASIDRELAITGRAWTGASPDEPRPEDGPPKAAASTA